MWRQVVRRSDLQPVWRQHSHIHHLQSHFSRRVLPPLPPCEVVFSCRLCDRPSRALCVKPAAERLLLLAKFPDLSRFQSRIAVASCRRAEPEHTVGGGRTRGSAVENRPNAERVDSQPLLCHCYVGAPSQNIKKILCLDSFLWLSDSLS